MSETDRTPTQYHMAKFYLERLNDILKSLAIIRIHRSDREAKNPVLIWRQNYNMLLDLYQELAGKMIKLELTEHENIRKMCKAKLDKSIQEFKKTGTTNTQFFDYFDNWELKMRIWAAQRGLLMPDRPKENKAMDL